MLIDLSGQLVGPTRANKNISHEAILEDSLQEYFFVGVRQGACFQIFNRTKSLNQLSVFVP